MIRLDFTQKTHISTDSVKVGQFVSKRSLSTITFANRVWNIDPRFTTFCSRFWCRLRDDWTSSGWDGTWDGSCGLPSGRLAEGF